MTQVMSSGGKGSCLAALQSLLPFPGLPSWWNLSYQLVYTDSIYTQAKIQNYWLELGSFCNTYQTLTKVYNNQAEKKNSQNLHDFRPNKEQTGLPTLTVTHTYTPSPPSILAARNM